MSKNNNFEFFLNISTVVAFVVLMALAVNSMLNASAESPQTNVTKNI